MENNCMHPEEHKTVETEEQLGTGQKSKIYVCGLCGAPLDGDPVADRADAMAEYDHE
jgi:hypothetical protein